MYKMKTAANKKDTPVFNNITPLITQQHIITR